MWSVKSQNPKTEDSIACKLCGNSSDRKENLNVPMIKDQNSETE